MIDYEAEYNNRARVPEHPQVMAAWTRDAAAYREQHAPRRLSYGPGPRHAIDLFEAGDSAPVVVFIHGGYWQALDGATFSHCARGLNAHGVTVAVPTYDLCPTVTVATIIAGMRDALRALAPYGRRLVVSGHSAGGHLAACMLATNWPALDPALPKDFVGAAYSISGLFELEPLVPTSVNTALRLDAASAREASPLLWAPPKGGVLDAVVGANESAEYLRQSRDIAERWGEAGVATRFDTIDGANHFTAIAPLAEPNSAMVQRLKDLAGR